MSRELPIGQAKARFAECVRRAEHGETVVLTRHGRPVARLAGLEAAAAEHGGEIRESDSSYQLREPAEATPEVRRAAVERLLEEEIWPLVPKECLGRGVDKRERETILGYRSDGV